MSGKGIITPMKTNVLYYGDNFDILRHHIPDDSIDLLYLDPPFTPDAKHLTIISRSPRIGAAIL
jgi:hypothetical protein